jgi:hypothetical protein
MRSLALFLFALTAATPLSARVALLVAEPFGAFGRFNPTGHAAVYLSGACAESPVKLRLCAPGESGVVISRYNGIGGYDWVAVPLLPYLYAVERPEDVPESANALDVAQLRDGYRRLHLENVAPDGPEGETPGGHWIQLVGSAYDRTIYGFALETTPEDDARLIEYLNSRPNSDRFNLFYRNCADFARGVVNFYYPRAVRRSLFADAGITTPKHLAKALATYSRRRELDLTRFVIPQIPGGPKSTKIRGVSESLVHSKKYVVPLVVLQPWIAGTAAVAYFTTGRFNPVPESDAVCSPGTLHECVAGLRVAQGEGPAAPRDGKGGM